MVMHPLLHSGSVQLIQADDKRDRALFGGGAMLMMATL